MLYLKSVALNSGPELQGAARITVDVSIFHEVMTGKTSDTDKSIVGDQCRRAQKVSTQAFACRQGYTVSLQTYYVLWLMLLKKNF